MPVISGAGRGLATQAMDRAGNKFDAVLSTGVCGALDPQLRVGEVLAATAVNGQPAQVPGSQTPCRSGPLVSVDRIVGSVAEKKALHAEGFVAVEMEAAAVEERARRWNVPFYCVRAVSDTAAEEFELDLNAARDETGRIRVSKILFQAAMRPFAIVPELLRLRRNSQNAARALGAFLATCDF